uniref:Uncharacterized protein n=1 Tax=viral metagenome TaxID=1070528 RepID=A0A6C0BZN2_9ZZZZ
MGAGTSSTYMVSLVALSVAILYLAWRSGQIQKELHELKAAMEATVSLHEIEDQLLPAIDTLEQDIMNLKRDVYTPKRGCQMTEPASDNCSNVFSEAFPDISLLMGMQHLIGGAYVPGGPSVATHVTETPTARFILSTDESLREMSPRENAHSEEEELASNGGIREVEGDEGVYCAQDDYNPEL